MMTTFLHDGELNQPTSDKEVNLLMKLVREKTKENWQVIERSVNQRQSWRKSTTVKVYEVYHYVGGMGPWHQINFYPGPYAESSINGSGNVMVVTAFLYGLLAGLHDENKNG